jgi:hypothetical protein
MTAGLDERTFRSHARAEIWLAWREAGRRSQEPDLSEVREALFRRMLRAPGWAARYVGWPVGQLAGAYLDRLAATRVTLAGAQHAARQITLDNAGTIPAGQGRRAGPRRAAVQERSQGTIAAPRRPPQLLSEFTASPVPRAQ